MSFDIDMQDYGRTFSDPAAVDQPKLVDTNSYSQEAEEFPVNQDLLDSPNETVQNFEKQEINPQAEHFRALREEVDRIKSEKEAEKREFQIQIEMLRANQAQPKQEQKPKQMFDGMDESDVPNVAELRKEWNEREAGYQARLEELQVQQMHSDYAEVIEKYAIPLVRQKPHLAEGLQGANNKALFAYELGKMAQQMQQNSASSAPQRNENAQRMVDNSKKPGTLSQAGGQNTLSKADYFATMSDQEFMRMATRNLEGI